MPFLSSSFYLEKLFSKKAKDMILMRFQCPDKIKMFSWQCHLFHIFLFLSFIFDNFVVR